MFNLFDILQAQNGQGMQALGQQFGLSPEQSLRAVEALLPALSMGLQRNAADPAGLGRLFGLAAPQTARSGQPDFLGHLFGSQALSQAVLQQAASASGIGTQALRQMLPVMAGMVVAGIVHMMLNQQPLAPAPRVQPEPPKPAFPAADFWKDWMDNFMTGANGSPSARETTQAPTPKAASRPVPARLVETPPRAEAETSKPAGDVPLDVLQQMFQTGAQVQEQNVKAMQNLFDTFWKRPTEAPSPPAEPQTTDGAMDSSKRADADKPRRSRSKAADQPG